MPSPNSSWLAWVEYDAVFRTLQIGLRNGRTYTLRGVPVSHYHGLLEADSPGWYFNAFLRGRY